MEGAIEGALRLKALCFGTGEASSGRREDARERHHLTITTRRCQVDVRARPAGERDRERGMRVVVSGVFAREFRAFSQKNARAQDAGKTAVVGSPAASHADLALPPDNYPQARAQSCAVSTLRFLTSSAISRALAAVV